MAESILPKEAEWEKPEMTDFRWLFHGFPKVGKTTLASYFPDALFLKFEEGTKGLKIRGISVDSWLTLCNVVEALEKEKHDFKTVVIDTIELAFYMLEVQICAEQKVMHIRDVGYGKGYFDLYRRMRNLLEHLYRDLRLGVVLLSHSKIVTARLGGMEIPKAVPDLSDSARRVIVGWCDIIGYLETEEVETDEGDVRSVRRVLRLQPAPEHEAGGRLRYLPDSLVLPAPAEGYRALQQAFDDAVEKFMEELD